MSRIAPRRELTPLLTFLESIDQYFQPVDTEFIAVGDAFDRVLA